MGHKMIVNAVDPEEIRVAILGDGGKLDNLDIETRGTEKNKGNIYKGVVKAVEPSLNAAFVDYGAEKEGFLTAGDVDPKYAGKKGEGERNLRITDLLKPKQTILVQVDKDEVGTKGAVLTTYLSLAGRYLVLMPGANRTGVSRRIEDEETRNKIREATARLSIPEGMGVIIRTAGRDRTKTDLSRDLKVLLRVWDNIQKKEARAKGPALILKEQDMVIRALRDYFSTEIDEIVVDSDDAYDRAAEYMGLVMPKQRSVLTRYVERQPIFHHYRVEEQIEVLYSSKVPLPSGGSIVIESTEALVAVDVNSGKQKEKGHEATSAKTNLEAAEEIARQLRLRDLGGIVVVDFIDMLAKRHNQQVEKAMKAALKDDKARVKVGRISPNGTLELTRQRLRSALRASVFTQCQLCHGTGHILNPESHAVAALRRLLDRAAHGDLRSAKVRLESRAAEFLRTTKWSAIQEIEKRHGITIDVTGDRTMCSGQDDFAFEKDPEAVVQPLPEPNFGPPEGFGEELIDDDDAEETDEAAEGAPKTRKRRRRRKKSSTERAAPAADAEESEADANLLALPTFELIDLDSYHESTAKRGRGRAKKSSSEQQAGGQRKRRPRKRTRRGGKKTEPVATPPPPPKKGIGSFFRKLFGMDQPPA